MKTTTLFDFPVLLNTKTEILKAISDFIQSRSDETRHIVTLNPEMLMQGEQLPAFGQILKKADWVIPDGAGVVWALRKKGIDVDRLPGIELAEALLFEAEEQRWPVALIGASPEVCQSAVAQILTQFPHLDIHYSHHGYFNDEESPAIAEACAEMRPALVFVALGVPRQEEWINTYRHLFEGTVLMGVGGSFDVWSGLKKRAPAFFLNTHTEWLYRITSEPWRIKRVCKTLPQFALRVILRKRC